MTSSESFALASRACDSSAASNRRLGIIDPSCIRLGRHLRPVRGSSVQADRIPVLLPNECRPVIQFRKLCLARGTRVLFSDASLQIHPGWRVGLTGASGSGKSSLFARLRGDLHEDRGELGIPPGWVIAHVAQETPALACSALDYVLDGDVELRAVEGALAEAEAAHDGA